jgi:adenylate kinase family enzyme
VTVAVPPARRRTPVRVSLVPLLEQLTGAMYRILIFGNSGSGKSTMARRLSATLGIPHLDLDQLAWSSAGVRRPHADSAGLLDEFLAEHEGWIAEGCYGDLIELLLPHATEVRFLNPGTEACVANCERRPWEPEKYGSAEEQNANLDFLLEWVRQYGTRSDEYSLARHRELFDGFSGPKQEHTGSSTGG